MLNKELYWRYVGIIVNAHSIIADKEFKDYVDVYRTLKISILEIVQLTSLIDQFSLRP